MTQAEPQLPSTLPQTFSVLGERSIAVSNPRRSCGRGVRRSAFAWRESRVVVTAAPRNPPELPSSLTRSPTRSTRVIQPSESKPRNTQFLRSVGDDSIIVSTGHLLLFEAARFGQEEGYEQLHLGSGVGGTGDSLFEFKRRFISSPAIEPAFGKGVHDVQRYRDLTGSTEVDSEGFFPAYRCELSETAPPNELPSAGSTA